MAKRRKKYKPVSKLTCRYCLFFYKSVQRAGSQGEVHRRFCFPADDWREVDDEACDGFEPAEYLWCMKNEEWITFSICSHRRNNMDKYNKYIKCKRCYQKKNIALIIFEEEEEVVVISKPRKIRKLKRLRRGK